MVAANVQGVRWLIVAGLALTLGASACTADADGSAAPVDTTAATTAAAPAPTGLTRLSNREYDIAVNDLLGVQGPAESTFPADDLTSPTTDERFEHYFNAADTLGEQVFASPLLASRVLTCSPGADAACTREIVTALGTRAWRGPLESSDIDRLTKVAVDALALGETPVDSIKQVVKTVLASPQFLYHVDGSATRL
jgi:Protein of unknown function (DUF1595)/Protein of unknown function (DUF1587)